MNYPGGFMQGKEAINVMSQAALLSKQIVITPATAIYRRCEDCKMLLVKIKLLLMYDSKVLL